MYNCNNCLFAQYILSFVFRRLSFESQLSFESWECPDTLTINQSTISSHYLLRHVYLSLFAGFPHTPRTNPQCHALWFLSLLTRFFLGLLSSSPWIPLHKEEWYLLLCSVCTYHLTRFFKFRRAQNLPLCPLLPFPSSPCKILLRAFIQIVLDSFHCAASPP